MELKEKLHLLQEQKDLEKETFTTQFKTMKQSLNNGIAKGDKVKAIVASGLSLNIGSMMANHAFNHHKKQEIRRKLKELGVKNKVLDSSKTLGYLSKYKIKEKEYTPGMKSAIGAYKTFSVLKNPIGYYYAHKADKAEMEELKNHLRKNNIKDSTINKVEELRDKSSDKRTLSQKINDNKNELFGGILGLKNVALGYYGLYNLGKKVIDNH